MAGLSVDKLFTLLIFLIFAGSLLPTMVGSFVGVNTSGWSVGAIAIVAIVDLIIVGGIALAIKKGLMG